ncbi:hypothetical protein IJ707_05815, partial [bacterium]|nr:hypothetical protein [bacterium]
MGMQINGAGITELSFGTKKGIVSEQSVNKAVENQTEVASKIASDAISSAARAFLSKPSAPKLSEEDQSYVDGLKKRYIVDTGNPEKDARTNKAAHAAFD